jgi:hypothetical protein
MPNDEDFDGPLLVGTLLGGPHFSCTVTRRTGGNFLDYAGLGLLIAGLLAFTLIVLAPHGAMDNTIRAVGVLAITGRWVCWALVVAGLLYPRCKIWIWDADDHLENPAFHQRGDSVVSLRQHQAGAVE